MKIVFQKYKKKAGGYMGSNEIRQGILNKLKETEINYGVKIILAIESGSRGWGFAAKDADYDCRFLCVHSKDWYLSIFDKKDFIEYAVDEVFDIRGIDIKKTLQYIVKPDASIYEWLSSNEIYICNDNIVDRLKTLAIEFFNPISISWHYMGLARKMIDAINETDTAKIKKYFYILRPIANLEYISQYKKMPPMEYDRTFKEIHVSALIREAVAELKALKLKSTEHHKIPQHKLLLDYFNTEMERFTKLLKKMEHQKNRDYEQVNAVFKDIIERAWVDEATTRNG